MKTSALVATLLAVVTLLSASTTPTNPDFVKCRELPSSFETGLSAKEMIEMDLVSGVWTFNGQLFQFAENGNAHLFLNNRQGNITLHNCTWDVKDQDKHVILVLSDPCREPQHYRVEQTCDGIVLVNVADKKPMYLEYHEAKSASELDNTRTHLIGEWTNVTIFENTGNCDNQHGAFLSFVFHENGTYECQYGTETTTVQEYGVWELSMDGQFLLLNVTGDKLTETRRETKVIRIGQVDNHGLILEQAMKTNDISSFFCADNKTFAFIK